MSEHIQDSLLPVATRADFQALCVAWRPDLLRFARWLARDGSVAEDVVQESLLRAWKARRSLLDKRAIRQWLFAIVRNEHARLFSRRQWPTVDVDALTGTDEAALAVSDSQPLDDVRCAYRQLPEKYRLPLELQVVHGYSTAEIASRLGLTSAAVLTRLYRARHLMRALLGEA